MPLDHLLQPWQSADELKTINAIADALDRANSQINSCAVAARRLGLADSETKSIDRHLSEAWLTTYQAERLLRNSDPVVSEQAA